MGKQSIGPPAGDGGDTGLRRPRNEGGKKEASAGCGDGRGKSARGAARAVPGGYGDCPRIDQEVVEGIELFPEPLSVLDSGLVGTVGGDVPLQEDSPGVS